MDGERREREGVRTAVAVGLTGGIGAGKSTALALFAELGAIVLSADEVVHRIYEQAEIVKAVSAHFGDRVLNGDGSVDRVRLASAVRRSPEELRWLEVLTHSKVADEIQERVGNAPPGSVVVCEVPLLFESGYEYMFDLIVTVEADSEIRRQRSDHSFDLDQFGEFEDLQLSQEQRRRNSDLAYVNDGSVDELREFVVQAYAQALELVGGRSSAGRP